MLEEQEEEEASRGRQWPPSDVRARQGRPISAQEGPQKDTLSEIQEQVLKIAESM
jgi:hypothetical protein